MDYWKQSEQNIIAAVADIYPGNSSARGGYLHAARLVCRTAGQCDDPGDAWKALNQIVVALEKGVMPELFDPELG